VSRVYLFNLIDRDRYGSYTWIVVNGDGAAPYKILNTYPSIQYVPFSTSGARVPGTQPQDNAFVDINQLLVTDGMPKPVTLSLLYNAVQLPRDRGDLLAYFSACDILLFDQAGLYVAEFEPSSQKAGATGDEESAGPAGNKQAAAGSVLIFNIFSEDVTVSSNGGTVGTIKAWSNGSGPVPIYTPSVLPAQRVLNQSQGRGKIFNGKNRIDLSSQEAPGWFDLRVDGNRYPLDQTLLLFISRDFWRLTTQFGLVADEGYIQPALGAAVEASPSSTC
jgi:hypothetical protein